MGTDLQNGEKASKTIQNREKSGFLNILPPFLAKLATPLTLSPRTIFSKISKFSKFSRTLKWR